MSIHQSTVLTVLNHGALTQTWIHWDESSFISRISSDFGDGLLVVTLWVIS